MEGVKTDKITERFINWFGVNEGSLFSNRADFLRQAFGDNTTSKTAQLAAILGQEKKLIVKWRQPIFDKFGVDFTEDLTEQKKSALNELRTDFDKLKKQNEILLNQNNEILELLKRLNK